MLSQLDQELFQLINGRWTCGLMDRLSVAINDPWWLWIPLGLLALWLWFKGGKANRRFIVVLIITVAATDLLCSHLLKPLLGRLRPSATLEGVRLLVGKKTGWSMPSNHAANIAAAACLTGYYFRKLLFPAIIIALLVAYCRIYAGIHYPMDVFLGAVIGVFMAALGITLAEKIASKK